MNDRFAWAPGDIAVLVEKYNENHDPDDGKFTSGHSGSGGRPDAAKRIAAAPKPRALVGHPLLADESRARKFIERDLRGYDTRPVDWNSSMDVDKWDDEHGEWSAHSIENEIQRSKVKQGIVDLLAKNAAQDPDAKRAADAWSGSNPQIPLEAHNKAWLNHHLAEATNVMLSNWACTSADSVPSAVALQLAAARVLGLPKESANSVYRRYLGSERALTEGRWLPGEKEKKRQKELEEQQKESDPMNEVLVRTMYEQTQKELADHQIKEVTLYRGMALDEGGAPEWVLKDGVGELTQQPLSSWTSDRTTAESFAKLSVQEGDHDIPYGHARGVVLAATFPAGRIVSTARTGVGALHEYEWVVSGGPIEAKAETTVPAGRS